MKTNTRLLLIITALFVSTSYAGPARYSFMKAGMLETHGKCRVINTLIAFEKKSIKRQNLVSSFLLESQNNENPIFQDMTLKKVLVICNENKIKYKTYMNQLREIDAQHSAK